MYKNRKYETRTSATMILPAIYNYKLHGNTWLREIAVKYDVLFHLNK